jgi:hypothetical protein
MSKTKKGKKPVGDEYWGKRPINKRLVSSGPKAKRDGIQRERAIAKREIDLVLDEEVDDVNLIVDIEDMVFNEDLPKTAYTCFKCEAKKNL